MEQIQDSAPQLDWIKKRLARGDYCISEHVTRMLTTGRISMSELEESLKNGQISEYRRNRQGRLGSLVHGHSGKKEISSLCIRDDSQQMNILLSYLSHSAGWQRDQGIVEREEEAMNSEMRQCFFCGGDVVPIIVGNFDYRLEGQLYVIKKVPAGLCQECGEKYITSRAAFSINETIDRQDYDGTEQVQVMLFPQEQTS